MLKCDTRPLWDSSLLSVSIRVHPWFKLLLFSCVLNLQVLSLPPIVIHLTTFTLSATIAPL